MIPVIWHAERDNAPGRYNCTNSLNIMFAMHDCQHIPALPGINPRVPYRNLDGAVFVVHGGRQPGSLDRLQMDLDRMKWALVIFLGDEEASFPAEQVKHDNMIAWVQEPVPGRHDFAKRFLLDGWPHDLEVFPFIERDLDWVFAGQVTHERRRACCDALRTMDWGGITVETKGFCQGVSRSEYYRLLSRARIVPCPSGPFAPDAARPWESLQCGAIPILDDLSPTRHEPGFWKMVLGDHPLPVITDWWTLPDRIEEIKSDYQRIRQETQAWWHERYLPGFWGWLSEDLKCLGTKI